MELAASGWRKRGRNLREWNCSLLCKT